MGQEDDAATAAAELPLDAKAPEGLKSPGRLSEEPFGLKEPAQIECRVGRRLAAVTIEPVEHGAGTGLATVHRRWRSARSGRSGAWSGREGLIVGEQIGLEAVAGIGFRKNHCPAPGAREVGRRRGPIACGP